MGIRIIYAFARSRVSTDSISWLTCLTKTAMTTKHFIYILSRKKRNIEALIKFRETRKKLFASVILTKTLFISY